LKDTWARAGDLAYRGFYPPRGNRAIGDLVSFETVGLGVGNVVAIGLYFGAECLESAQRTLVCRYHWVLLVIKLWLS
jgi:hypothetical protein